MNTQKFYCDGCDGWVEEAKTHVIKRMESYPVKGGERIPVEARVRVCDTCNTDVSDDVLDGEALQTAYAIYRAKHGIMTAEEIATMRELYGLSQRSLSTLLGWGEITIHRYETGMIPDGAHAQLLQLVRDPWNMQKVFERNGDKLNPAARRKFEARLSHLMDDELAERLVQLVTSRHHEPSVLTGFAPFSADRLMEMALFFAKAQNGEYRTKLNKLLWYADFVHYRHNSISISGTIYCHAPHGPVPSQYDVYFNYLLKEGSLNVEEVAIGDNVLEKYVAGREPDTSAFNSAQIETLKRISEYFKSWSSTQIRELSHNEDGYIETNNGEPIPYSYAESLKAEIAK